MIKFLGIFFIFSLSTVAFAQVEQSIDSDELVVEDSGAQAIPTTEDETCDFKLQKHLQELLEKDHNGILGLHYHVTMLKLAKKVNSSSEKSLEDYIKKQSSRLAKLNVQDPSTLTRLHALYNGQADIHVKNVFANIEKMRKAAPNLDFIANKKIDNDDVASYVLFESMQDPKSEFTKTDVAISWMMKNIRTRAAGVKNAAALDFTNQIARYTGLVQGTTKASNKEIDKELADIKRKIDIFMSGAKESLMALHPECNNNGQWAGECSGLVVNSQVADIILSLDDVSKKLAQQISKNVASRTRGKKAVAIGNEQNNLNSCGGKYFVSKDLGNSTWLYGKKDKKAATDAAERALFSGGSLSFGPVICDKSFKKFFVQLDAFEKETCCSNKVTQYTENKAAAGIFGTFQCRGFYGIPYVAEVGVKGGIDLEASMGGRVTINEKTCKSKGCIFGSALARPYLAIYGDVLSGAASVEGGVNWEPHLKAEYCKEESSKGNFKVALIPNDVNLYYKASAGWGLVAKVGTSTIYKNTAELVLYDSGAK